jgi:hypothetical protein
MKAFPHDAAVVQGSAHKCDFPMAVPDHIFGCHVASLHIINPDIYKICIPAVTVYEDNRNIQLLFQFVQPIAVHADGNNSIQVSLVRYTEKIIIHIQSGDQYLISFFPGFEFDRPKNLTVEIIAEDLMVFLFRLRDDTPMSFESFITRLFALMSVT